MLHTYQNLLNAILVLVALYGLVCILKSRNILHDEHSQIFARVVTDLCLPAAIFGNLAGRTITWHQISPSLRMLGLELFCIALAWFVCTLLRFDKAQQGAVVFCSAFGSSTFMGYPIIMEMYGHNSSALAEAILMSEIGVGYPIFIAGPILATYFATGSSNIRLLPNAVSSFVRSPVFFALILGILWRHLQLPGPENIVMAPLFQLCSVLSNALMLFALLAVGILFSWPSFSTILLPLLVVVGIKLLLKPTAAHWFMSGYPVLWQQVAVILSAMPPALLGVIYIKRHGGDASLASALLLAATVCSSATAIGMFYLLD